jgi:DNA recombination protein RmuC
MASIIISFIAGLAVSAALALVYIRMRASTWGRERELLSGRAADAAAELERERATFREIGAAFKGISSDVLRTNREDFLKQAEPALKEHIRPLADALARYEKALCDIERRREDAYGGMKELMGMIRDGQRRLSDETNSLVTALKSPAARGRWGEMTLRRVVEVAGMSEYCDFEEQKTVDGEGGRQRPDMVVRLYGGRTIVVDAKAPIDSYLDAMEATDDAVRSAKLAAHAKAVREHMRSLGSKTYWSAIEQSTDFVVMFLPGESFYAAALEQDRSLIEDGMANKVILATPTTLIVMLKSVALGWQQQRLQENSRLISEAGRELFERCSLFADHMSKVGQGLDRVVETFNKAVGSWESRVLPSARKLKDLGASKDTNADLPEIEQVDHIPRVIPPPQGMS